MSDRIDAAAAATSRARIDPTPLGAGAIATGEWRGQAVQIEPKAGSLLENAKEELTFAHSETIESKEISAREITEAGHTRVEDIEDLDGYFDRLPHFNRAELQALLRDLRQSEPDEDAILAQVGARFDDPSHAYAALDLAEQALRRDNLTELADRVGAARARLLAEQGPAIRAGLNVSIAADAAADGDRQGAAELRDYYRSTVFGAPSPAALYGEIVGKFGVEGFAQRVGFLTRALGDDLAAAGSSVEPARLRQILDGLSALRVLDTVHDRADQLAGRLQRVSQVTVTPTEVMRQLLPLTTEPVSGPSKINPIPGRLGVPATKLPAQIGLLRETRDIMAMLPPVLYRDMDARAAVLRGVQEAMDILIEREEAA